MSGIYVMFMLKARALNLVYSVYQRAVLHPAQWPESTSCWKENCKLFFCNKDVLNVHKDLIPLIKDFTARHILHSDVCLLQVQGTLI